MDKNPRPSWRALAKELRRRGLPRYRDDTRATMAARIARDERAARDDAIKIAPALVAAPALLDELRAPLARVGVRRVAPDVALIPREHLTRLVRTLRRRRLNLVDDPPPAELVAMPPRSPAAERAALLFVAALAETADWPVQLRPPALAAATKDVESADPEVAALVAAWTGALEAAWEPLAEVASVSTGVRPVSPDSTALLARAIEEGQPIVLVYESGERGRRTRRVVEPRFLDGTTLRAFCRWRGGVRDFRLDRIIAATPLIPAE